MNQDGIFNAEDLVKWFSIFFVSCVIHFGGRKTGLKIFANIISFLIFQ